MYGLIFDFNFDFNFFLGGGGSVLVSFFFSLSVIQLNLHKKQNEINHFE